MSGWQRAGDCLSKGDWRIFRYAHAEPPRYELWHWPKHIKDFPSADEAKAEQERIVGE